MSLITTISPAVMCVGCVCVLALLVAMVGAIVDGIFWNVLDHTRGCYNPYSNKYYGDQNYALDAISCTTFSEIGNPSYRDNCYCVQAGTDHCLNYALANDADYNCGDILDTYRDWLNASTIICIVLTVGSLLNCILICTAGCMARQNSSESNHHQFTAVPTNGGAVPTVVEPNKDYATSSEAIQMSIVDPVNDIECQPIQDSKL